MLVMGNASTRRITVANEGGVPSVIKVSDSVIGRLKEANEPPPQKRVQEKPVEIAEPVQPAPVPPAPAQIEAPPVAAIEEPPAVIPEPTPQQTPHEQPPVFAQQPQQVPNNYFFPEEAHLALLRLRQERELELKKVEDYWREKLKIVESKYVNLNKLTSEEFAKSVAEVETLYKKEPCGPICQDMEKSVIKCYQDNPKQSLVCSSIVKDFSQCVASASLNALSQAG